VDVHARLAERAIGAAKRAGKPFFLSLAPNAPHTVADQAQARIEGTPALPPPRYADRFAQAELPRYPNFDEVDISDKPTTLAAYFPNLLSADDIASLTEHYRGRMGSLLAVDDLVARVVRALKRARAYRDTVIVFTSDNGWILGEHRLRDPVSSDGRAVGVKYVPYEGSSRVPLLIAGPGFPAGRTVRGVTVNADLAPTILRLTGARATVPLDGISLLGAARRPRTLHRRAVLIQTATNPRDVPPYAAVRTQRYRYDLQADGQEGLYDLKRDPWELESVHADPRYARIKAILARRLAKLQNCRGASCRTPVRKLPAPG
jgi:arylsulfatase A-like enzyme